jgi:hypothetical protein
MFYLEAAPLVADLRAASTLPLMSDTLAAVRWPGIISRPCRPPRATSTMMWANQPHGKDSWKIGARDGPQNKQMQGLYARCLGKNKLWRPEVSHDPRDAAFLISHIVIKPHIFIYRGETYSSTTHAFLTTSTPRLWQGFQQ